MEISVKRIYSFLSEFISPSYEDVETIGKLMLPTCKIITEDCTKQCHIVDIKINKIIELTEKHFGFNDIFHINYKDKEQFYIMSNLILDRRGTPLLCVKKTNETVKVNGRDVTQVYDNFYVSSEVMLDTKSWICFVIRKYIIYYILDGKYQRKRVHVINNRDMLTLVKCRVNKYTHKNIAKLKIINGDND